MSLTLIPPIVCELNLPLSIEEAFYLFTYELGNWWPRSYTWSKETLVKIGLEPRINGLCYEKANNNFTLNWGTVLVWQPPTKLVIAWQIAYGGVPEPNINKSSRVTIAFNRKSNTSTTLRLVHDNLHRHGSKGQEYRNTLASIYGWEYLLECYKVRSSELVLKPEKSVPEIYT